MWNYVYVLVYFSCSLFVLVRMQASNPEGILIPSVFVGSNTGLFIKDNYVYDKGFVEYDFIILLY